MTVYFLTKQLPVCTTIAKNLEINGNDCFVYDNTLNFHNAVSSLKIKPDLFVFDYSLFNHLIFNIYKYMKKRNYIVPLIFYNDPYPVHRNRAFYWKNMLSLFYDKNKIDISRYDEILNAISEILYGIEQENGLISSGTKETESFRNIADRLSSSAYLIYETLYQNMERTVSIKELQQKIKRGNNIPKETTIFCIISKIRNIIEENPECRKSIIKTGSGYRLISY